LSVYVKISCPSLSITSRGKNLATIDLRGHWVLSIIVASRQFIVLFLWSSYRISKSIWHSQQRHICHLTGNKSTFISASRYARVRYEQHRCACTIRYFHIAVHGAIDNDPNAWSFVLRIDTLSRC